MSIAIVVAQRSIDPSTKVGCVVINEEKSILTTGYNGPPRGMDDSNIPLYGNEKYNYFSHAEINSIANAARHGISLRNSTFYVTTPPCDVCFRSIINCGVKRVIYGPIPTGHDSKYNFDITKRMASESKIELLSLKEVYVDIKGCINQLEKSIKYINDKIS
ncbi:dCMP deaminase family protein [Candidatus Gracilibacteria bacterium]|nr:dCMP deaminase family protein [Candidatus Gracilibacteria bacterium]